MMDYSLKKIAHICRGSFSGRDSRADTVITDSRHSFGAEERPLFVAMKGLNHDGHRFIGDLYRRGVRAFLVERDVDAAEYPEAGFVRVERSLTALQALAADYRASFGGTVVAITGSAGKTAVKEAIAQAAPEGVAVFRSPRSYNSQLGVALSILMMRGDENMAVIEAGISRPGEMERLAAIIRPDIGIFTGLGPEHGENFSSPRQKAQEKAKLFAACGKVIYDGSPLLEEALRTEAPSAELIGPAGCVSGDSGAQGVAAANAAFALALYDALGMRAGKGAPELAAMDGTSTRLGLSEGIAGSLIVADRDNTDINSLAIALDYLNRVAAGRQRMAILSDILFSSLPDAELYTRAASALKASGVERFIGIGERISRHAPLFGDGAPFYRTADEFLKNIGQAGIGCCAILVKGNPSSGFEKIIHRLERRTHTTVLEINLDAIIRNLDHYRSKLPEGTKVMAMVKAAGYGNGEYELAATLQGQGADYLAVAFADEGAALREQGITMPVVVLNADSDSFGLMVANRLEPEIYSLASLRVFADTVRNGAAEGYPVHIKLDTGMHRLGFEEKDIPELLAELRRESTLIKVRSLFSHLAAADMPGEDGFTRRQIEVFERACAEITQSLGYRPLRHICNSAGVERFPEAAYDMVRLGIGLYGISPSGGDAFTPVGSLTTRIVQIKELGDGETVGYGRAGVVKGRMRLATLPVGYADGLDRRLGEGRWSVAVNGRQAPTVGRISMDSCVVDITGIEASEGDTALIFGGNGANGITEMARVLGTIPYEIMTSIPQRVKRIFIKE